MLTLWLLGTHAFLTLVHITIIMRLTIDIEIVQIFPVRLYVVRRSNVSQRRDSSFAVNSCPIVSNRGSYSILSIRQLLGWYSNVMKFILVNLTQFLLLFIQWLVLIRIDQDISFCRLIMLVNCMATLSCSMVLIGSNSAALKDCLILYFHRIYFWFLVFVVFLIVLLNVTRGSDFKV